MGVITAHRARSWLLAVVLVLVAVGVAATAGHRAPPAPPPAVQAGRTASTTTSSAARAVNRPDPQLTPGVADPAVTQANIASTICVPGYSRSHRDVPQSEKDEVYREYGITHHAPGEYEIDHLISLELGGSNDIKNLWPEPYAGPDNARTKDGMENRLHADVCAGRVTLAQGQDEIAHWWMYE